MAASSSRFLRRASSSILYPAASFASGRASKYFLNWNHPLSNSSHSNRAFSLSGPQQLNTSTVYDLIASQYAFSSIFHAPGPAPYSMESTSVYHSAAHTFGSIGIAILLDA